MAEREEFERVNLRITTKDGECVTITVEAAPYEFTVGTRAKWEMVIADENLNVKKGECVNIKIRPITLHSHTIALPCAFNQHPIVTTLRINEGCAPKPVEAERTARYATALALSDGEVREGDLLGVLNIFPVMFTRNAREPIIVSER